MRAQLILFLKFYERISVPDFFYKKEYICLRVTCYFYLKATTMKQQSGRRGRSGVLKPSTGTKVHSKKRKRNSTRRRVTAGREATQKQNN